MGKYKVVTLCGSTKFKDDYMKAQTDLTMKGHIVLLCPTFPHADGFEESVEISNMHADMHKQRIDMADKIHVINKNGYIGNSTLTEIMYARRQGKEISYMYPEEVIQKCLPFNYKDLEQISQEEFDLLKERFEKVATGLTNFNWENSNRTVINFYAYHMCFYDSDSARAIDPDNEWDVRIRHQGGHDEGSYGTIRKKVN